jgi:hypothetical protein
MSGWGIDINEYSDGIRVNEYIIERVLNNAIVVGSDEGFEQGKRLLFTLQEIEDKEGESVEKEVTLGVRFLNFIHDSDGVADKGIITLWQDFLEEYPEINEPQKDLELLAAMKRIDIDRLSASQK